MHLHILFRVCVQVICVFTAAKSRVGWNSKFRDEQCFMLRLLEGKVISLYGKIEGIYRHRCNLKLQIHRI